jgi:hypothetical protein
MAREIKVEEAASWSQEETEKNLAYLEARVRWAEIRRVNELRAEGAEESSTTAAEAGSDVWFSEATAKEVAEWVGDDRERAQEAYNREQAKDKPRVKLTERLEQVLATPQ